MSNRRPDLKRQAREFAGQLSKLLNGTVTNGIRLRTYLQSTGNAVVGYEVSFRKPLGAPIPLTVSQSAARLCLSVLNTLNLDDSGEWLATSKSRYMLQRCDDTKESIITYEYMREPPNNFPEAHFHIHGESDMLQNMLDACGRNKDKPADLHLPVGGRRFRPCLEDIIEFCILEQLVTPRDNWRDTLKKSRDLYYDQQLRAATRRAPDIVTEALKSSN